MITSGVSLHQTYIITNVEIYYISISYMRVYVCNHLLEIIWIFFKYYREVAYLWNFLKKISSYYGHFILKAVNHFTFRYNCIWWIYLFLRRSSSIFIVQMRKKTTLLLYYCRIVQLTQSLRTLVCVNSPIFSISVLYGLNSIIAVTWESRIMHMPFLGFYGVLLVTGPSFRHNASDIY